MNFNTFARIFKVSKNTLSPQSQGTHGKKLILRFWPQKKAYGYGAKYREYCKFRLIRFKPWRVDPSTMLNLPFRDDIERDERNSIELDAYEKLYHEWLETEDANILEFLMN